MLKMDPDYANVIPLTGDKNVIPVRELDVWEQTARVQCPMMIVQGLKSSRWTPELIAKLQNTFPKIRWATADCMHDVAYYAPDELVAAQLLGLLRVTYWRFLDPEIRLAVAPATEKTLSFVVTAGATVVSDPAVVSSLTTESGCAVATPMIAPPILPAD